jgi:hypothetical protein
LVAVQVLGDFDELGGASSRTSIWATLRRCRIAAASKSLLAKGVAVL